MQSNNLVFSVSSTLLLTLDRDIENCSNTSEDLFKFVVELKEKLTIYFLNAIEILVPETATIDHYVLRHFVHDTFLVLSTEVGKWK